MTWVAPTIRATGDLITASIWNTEHVGDLSGQPVAVGDESGLAFQDRVADQSKGIYGANQFGPENWTQFMNVQTPMMQNMMNSYVEQSKNLFVQMQDKMQDQTRAMFSTFPFGPQGEPGGQKEDKS